MSKQSDSALTYSSGGSSDQSETMNENVDTCSLHEHHGFIEPWLGLDHFQELGFEPINSWGDPFTLPWPLPDTTKATAKENQELLGDEDVQQATPEPASPPCELTVCPLFVHSGRSKPQTGTPSCGGHETGVSIRAEPRRALIGPIQEDWDPPQSWEIACSLDGDGRTSPEQSTKSSVVRHSPSAAPSPYPKTLSIDSEATRTTSDHDWSTSAEDSAEEEFWAIYDPGCLQDFPEYPRQAAAILRSALHRFAPWSCQSHQKEPSNSETANGSQAGSSNSVQNSDAPKSRGSQKGVRRKRSAGESRDSGDEDDHNEDRGSKRAKGENPGDEGPCFACPFYKFDFAAHHKCLNLTLRRVRDVKQHLVRRHQQPLFCITCGQTFETQHQQESHLLQRSCTRPDTFVRPPGITRDHREKFASRVSKMLSGTEQWFSVWDIIFPGASRPQSPYVSAAVEEVVDMVRRFWEENGRSIIADQLATADMPYNFPAEERLLSTLASHDQASTTGAIRSQTSLPDLTSERGSNTVDQIEEPPEQIFGFDQHLSLLQHNEEAARDCGLWSAEASNSLPGAGSQSDTLSASVLAPASHMPFPSTTRAAAARAEPDFIDVASHEDALQLNIAALESSAEYDMAMSAFDTLFDDTVERQSSYGKNTTSQTAHGAVNF
ncbi:uncharacterized protein B0I36DRAFT_363195 [Microdochium trichocladiopsis]|uniref:C2H2-type domain-containing protein n=1 Tax=Microdochium trichocladiopsis TaxID=1682393 RepID=A0A9P8Y7X8_9PEZI|nr:uncharacterized protein B0I36DRAFT_363195 [Microdochium trichocladiopsis]KAH7031513.1 hypothetical protein B0I36DRAFT_363195 [Microdochium trichocladiopsis]